MREGEKEREKERMTILTQYNFSMIGVNQARTSTASAATAADGVRFGSCDKREEFSSLVSHRASL